MDLLSRKILFLLVIFYAVGPAFGSNHTGNFSGESSTLSKYNGKYRVVIELSIVNDFEFSSIFNHNYQKLLNYWRAVLWDVHLRFKNLQNISVSFRVNSIIIVKDKEEQDFIEKARQQDGTVNYTSALSNFGSWLYLQAIEQNLTQYDIAIAAVGSAFSDDYLGGANEGFACSVDIMQRKVDSALVITMKSAHVASILAHEIAHLLDAPHDTEEEYKQKHCEIFNATEDQYVMAYDSDKKLWEYFFSPCSQLRMETFLKKTQADCLRRLSSPKMPLINTANRCLSSGEISIEEQCQIVLNDKSTYILQSETNCVEVKCRVDLARGMFSTYKKVDPLDGSKCKDGNAVGTCFLGSCVQPGGHLLNVATGLCLGNRDPFGVNDTPILYDCLNSESFSPMEVVRLKQNTSGVHISMIYSSANGSDTGEKCLSLTEEQNGKVTFENCMSDSRAIAWELERVNEDAHFELSSKLEPINKFILYHPISKKCIITVHNSTSLFSITNCSVNDTRQQWRYIGESEMQKMFSCRSKQEFLVTSNSANYVVFQFYDTILVLLFLAVTV